MLRLRFILFLSILLLLGRSSQAQEVPIGSWYAHTPYNSGIAIANGNNKIYVASQYAFYTYDLIDHTYDFYSKVNGMNEIGVSTMNYDSQTGYVLIAYTNSNIDLFKNGSFTNISDIKNKNLTGDKGIYDIWFSNGFAYLSTGFGVVKLDLAKQQIKETFVISTDGNNHRINDFVGDGTNFYAVSDQGLFRANVNEPNLISYNSWQNISNKSLQGVELFAQQIVAASADSLYKLSGNSLVPVRKFKVPFVSMHSLNEQLSVLQRDQNTGDKGFWLFDKNLVLTDSANGSAYPYRTTVLPDGQIWVADYYQGLLKYILNDQFENHTPNSLITNGCQDMTKYNKKIYVVPGGVNSSWNFLFNRDGLQMLQQGDWSTVNQNNFPQLTTVMDLMAVVVDPRDETVYSGSFGGGLMAYNQAANTVKTYAAGYLPEVQGSANDYRVAGMAMDADYNLWMATYGTPYSLTVKKADGSFRQFLVPVTRTDNAVSQLILDDINQKWIVSPRGNGLLVYNDNGTIDNTSDDKVKMLIKGKGYGNLPSSDVNCIAKDRDGKIWIGTADGIGIINCPTEVLNTTSPCEAELYPVKFDEFAGLLFQGENVRAIAVDGANRKWIGSDNGVWLITDDLEKIVLRFTEKNSPLPSSQIQKIYVDNETGDVYIGTTKGLIVYRGTATAGGETNTDVTVYPNPVPSGFGGTIAIRGLVTDADVRITDVTGKLIYRTKALGGQAVWSGLDYTGNRPQSGVFLVFITNADGTQKQVSKFVFMH